MTVWADAAADILDDELIGEDAAYRDGGSGPPVTVRVTRSAPDDLALSLGQSVRIQTMVLTCLVADLTPRAGASFTLADGLVVTVVGAPARDVEGATWTMTCRPGGYSNE